MLIKLLIICVLSLLVTTEKARYDNYALYKLYPKSEEQIKFLKDLHQNGDGLDFWHLPTQVGDYASVVSTPEQRDNLEQSLRNQKIEWDLMQKNIQEAFDAQVQNRHKRSTNRELFWTAYQTQEQITEWFYQLAANHDFVSVVHAGNSHEGRNITGIRIARSSSRRAFFIEGGQVGADWLSPTVLTYFVDQLIRGEHPEARAASEEFEWHIFPVINPDGFSFSQDSVRLWTKNRRPLSLPGGRSGIGADLTRNWNSQWGVSGGSFNLAANNFIGLGPFSEIETRVVSRYIESIASNLVGVLSFRQFGQRLLIPFAHSSAPMYNYDEMLTVGRRAMGSLAVRYGTQYIVGTSRNVHDGSTGILADWAKHRFNPPIVATYHLRDAGAWGYTLPVTQVQPSCEETFDSLLAIIREAKFIDII